ncbi:MAG: alpha/beta hydrolase [Pseudomonadota bacterium]
MRNEPTREWTDLPDRGRIASLHWPEPAAGGVTVVLGHANGFCSDLWRPIARHLAQHFHVVAYDARGHGLSEQDAAPVNLRWEVLHDDLGMLLDHWRAAGRIQSPVVGVGHSMGGMIMSCVAGKRADLFDALMLLDPVVWWPEMHDAGGGTGRKQQLVDGALRRRSRFTSRQEAAQSWSRRETFAHWDAEVFEAYIEYGLRDVDGGAELRCAPLTEATLFDAHWDEDMRALARAIACPGIVAHAAEGHFRRELHTEFVELAPRMSLHDWSGSHFFPMEEPAETARWLVDNIRATME